MAQLIEAVKEILETTPPEVLADVMSRGIVLVGGGATIPGLLALLERELKLPIHIAHNPMTAVVRGAEMILENMEAYKEILISGDEDVASIES